jgi:hypothetical protein
MAQTAEGNDSISENVSTHIFKRGKRNKIEATELRFLNEMTKRLAQKESENATEKERTKRLTFSSVLSKGN